ncbi:MAG: phosphoglucosamine mutase [Microcystaceae cyanobacterium]
MLGTGLDLPPTPLFGTDGIRGKAGQLLTAPFALQLGFWAGIAFKKAASSTGTVVIGQDSRNSSDMLAMSIAAGLTSAGLDVWYLGLCPTPCVAHLTRNHAAIGGIMISASHNPPEDNGIKFFNQDGLKFSAIDAQPIEAGLRGQIGIPEKLTTFGKSQPRQEMVETYKQFLHQKLPQNTHFKGLRIVLDLAWGAAAQIAPLIFRELGADVISLHDEPNGDRINVNCGSTHLEKLQQAVIEYEADMGFAFDGDADRVMGIDNQGRIVDGDYILYFWGKILKERQQLPNDLIIGTVMANLGFERAWQQLGGQLIRTSVGDQHVQAQMWTTGAMLGGEQSGHILCHHHSYSGDGLQTALHLTTLVQEANCSLSELIEQSFQPYPQILRNVRVEDTHRRRHWQACDPLQTAIAQAESAMGDQGRILVRPSGTEPLIRVMVESASQSAADYWVDHLVKVVETYLAA